MAVSALRRPRVAAVAAALVVACLGAGAWAMTQGSGTDEAETTGTTVPTEATTSGDDNPALSGPVTPAAPTTTAAVPLPVPQPLPADEYAPTPEVVLGQLSLPTLGVSEPLGEGVTLTAVDRGPGHWPGTAMPGQVGNVVVAGHRTTNSRPFHDLDLLQPGDPLTFTMPDGTTWTYRLTSTEIVASDAVHIVDQTPAKTATLFACHPKGSDAQRIVAYFELVE
jgi:sortase A